MKKDKNIKVAKSGIVEGAYKVLCDDIKSILKNAQYRVYPNCADSVCTIGVVAYYNTPPNSDQGLMWKIVRNCGDF